MDFRSLNGVIVRQVIDRSNADVPEHAHDWPVLSLFVLGGYRNRTELGETFIEGPSAVLYRAGAAHRNFAASSGFEQIEIEFDPAWLGPAQLPDVPVSRWLGGRVGAEARALAHLCGRNPRERLLRTALRRFVDSATLDNDLAVPVWLRPVARRLHGDPSVKAGELARFAGLHPSWLGTAYRRAAGESLRQTAARLRVQRAACLLRETDRPDANVALAAGFCDQSHMIRTFRRVLGRLPSAVREERRNFRQLSSGSAAASCQNSSR